MKRTGSFIEEPILSPLLRFTFPVLLALFLCRYAVTASRDRKLEARELEPWDSITTNFADYVELPRRQLC